MPIEGISHFERKNHLSYRFAQVRQRMFQVVLLLIVALSNIPSITPSCMPQYGQCGGQYYTGVTACCPPSTCQLSSIYYSQCLEGTTTASTTQKAGTTTKAPTTTTQASALCGISYAQCGGIGWAGPTKCCTGSTCSILNSYYSQCIPIPGSSTSSSSTAKPSSTSASSTVKSPSSSSSTAKPSTISVPNDGRSNGVTTRYWDCCKASCGWSGKAVVTSPVKTCEQNGITQVDPSIQSVCNSGTAYMCNNQQPWSVNSTLSYGYAAAYITGQQESDWCCACYSLLFTASPVAGKQLIVQVTNTGGDLGDNHFDLQMPGGGFGIFDGCSSQFPTVSGSSWGQQYGGVNQRSDCYNLPSVLLSGCLWRFDWFMNADNPPMRFIQVTCPSALTANTGCSRK